jgi:lysophospholipid acyltransferase (LPLAT)-like uncharacterized protein
MRQLRRWVRRFLCSARLRPLVCWGIAGYIRLVYLTNRWSIEGGDIPRRLRADGKSFIGAFWHGRMMMIPTVWRRQAPMYILIAAYDEIGRIIADAIGHFGVASITGSTRHGGATALRAMLHRLADGDCVGITPDGPVGPPTVASSGIVHLARLSGVPIVPVTFATSRRRVLLGWGWDNLHLPLPFGRGVFLIGEPILVARHLDVAAIEDARQFVEDRLNSMTAEADRRVGYAGAMTTAAIDEYRPAASMLR